MHCYCANYYVRPRLRIQLSRTPSRLPNTDKDFRRTEQMLTCVFSYRAPSTATTKCPNSATGVDSAQ